MAFQSYGEGIIKIVLKFIVDIALLKNSILFLEKRTTNLKVFVKRIGGAGGKEKKLVSTRFFPFPLQTILFAQFFLSFLNKFESAVY